MSLTRVTVELSDNLLREVDEYVITYGIDRKTACRELIRRGLQKEVIDG